jgi:hypothetical protein
MRKFEVRGACGSPTATAAAAGAGGGGVCDQFVAQLCGRSGSADSALCGSAKELGKVLPESACAAGLKDFSQVERQIEADRKLCNDLLDRLCKDLGPDTATCALVREQTPQFPRERCEQLTANYDEVLVELRRHEAANQPLSPEQQARIGAKGAPGFGPEDAKVTIVEFSDFQCPYCARASEVVHKIRERYADKVLRGLAGRASPGQILGVPRPAVRQPASAVALLAGGLRAPGQAEPGRSSEGAGLADRKGRGGCRREPG